MKRSIVLIAVLLSVAIMITACSGGSSGGENTPTAKVPTATPKSGPVQPSAGEVTDLNFTTDGASFTGPDSTGAGWTRVFLQNNGTANSNMAFIKLNEGKTVSDLVSFLQASPDAPLPAWAVQAGGPGYVAPGVKTSATMNLADGDYALTQFLKNDDFISRPDPNLVKGFTVTPSSKTGTAPTPSVLVEIFDYGFTIDSVRKAGVTLTAPIDSGDNIFKVTNIGQVPHMFCVVELEVGKATQDFEGYTLGQDTSKGGSPRVRALPDLTYRDGRGPAGPPPGRALGGVMVVQPGETAYFAVTLRQGTYFVYDSLLNTETGKSMVMSRMINEFRVL